VQSCCSFGARARCFLALWLGLCHSIGSGTSNDPTAPKTRGGHRGTVLSKRLLQEQSGWLHSPTIVRHSEWWDCRLPKWGHLLLSYSIWNLFQARRRCLLAERLRQRKRIWPHATVRTTYDNSSESWPDCLLCPNSKRHELHEDVSRPHRRCVGTSLRACVDHLSGEDGSRQFLTRTLGELAAWTRNGLRNSQRRLVVRKLAAY
jgi:hypothetical protein